MLTKAHIKNFKSLRDVTLTFDRNNVLVGPNMSGKSNLIDFFRFVRDLTSASQGLSGMLSAFSSRMFASRNGFLDVIWKGAEDQIISFELEGTLNRNGKPSTWAYAVTLLGDLTWGHVTVQAEELTLTGDAGTSILIGTKDNRRTIYGRDGNQIIEIPPDPRLALEYEYPNWDAPLIKKSIFSWRFYNFIPQLMRKPNPSAAPEMLSTTGENLSSWLMLIQTSHSDSFDRIRSAAKDVLPDVQSIFTSPTAQSTVYLASRESNLRRPITVAEMSDGELVFTALLSLLYAPPELKPPVCFIEEPENHLHPRMLSILMGLFHQVQRELSSSEGQLFLTTHSPYLLDHFSIDEILLFSKKEGATRVSRPGNLAELKSLIADEQIGLGELYYTGILSGA
jgi:predicted ATPase